MSDHQSTAFASQRLMGITGAAFAALAIMMGAFGDHMLRRQLDEELGEAESQATAASDGIKTATNEKEPPTAEKRLEWFGTASHYHLIHSLAIVLVGLLGRRGKARIVGFASAGCFAMGIVLFSGGLYLLAVTAARSIAVVVPFGGVLFIAGWILFAFAAGMPRTSHAKSA